VSGSSTTPESDAAGGRTTPVLIVGGGPVGMVLAMWLDALGVPCTVVNDEALPRRLPKGSTQNARTMEHYRRLGVVDGIRALGLPSDRPTDVVYFTRYAGWELQRIRMPSEREKLAGRAAADPTDQVVEPVFRANQMEVEAFLFAHLATLPGIELRFGWRAVGLDTARDAVTVELDEVATGRRERYAARYVVGCDGGQSFVRRHLGIRYGGGEPARQAYLGGPMVSSHLRAPALHERVIGTPGWQYWAVNREVRSNTVCIDGHAELLFNTRLEIGQEPDDELVERAFVASVGASIGVEVVGHATWTAGQALVADRFADGRVLLAGDAVHLFTPTGGFGVNTGVDDAANLGWKLAAVVQGWGGPHLLDSYEAERRPIALRNTAAAKDLARSVGAVPVGEAIEEDSPAGAADRRAASEHLAGFGREFSSLGVQLGARYDSPIVVADGTRPPDDDPIAYVPSACPGGRAPHLWLEDGSSLFDHLGRGFTLLRIAGCAADVSPLTRSAQVRGVPLAVVDVERPEARELYERELALIRPDQHVAWRGDHLPRDCDALLARLTGWQPKGAP
jgi:2-polyprenyl-6-methoxyphenol hydroxylase-like FAD-dependent oxidoreductase